MIDFIIFFQKKTDFIISALIGPYLVHLVHHDGVLSRSVGADVLRKAFEKHYWIVFMMIVFHRRFLDAACCNARRNGLLRKKVDETAMLPAEAENGDAVNPWKTIIRGRTLARPAAIFQKWCATRDSNPQTFRRNELRTIAHQFEEAHQNGEKTGQTQSSFFRVYQCTLSSKPVHLTDPVNHLTKLIYSIDFFFSRLLPAFSFEKRRI